MENLDPNLIPETKVGDCNILFLDCSSSCTGYSIFNMDFNNKKATLKKAGCVWLPTNWEHGQKYSYIYNMVLTYFEVVEQIDLICHEAYSVNPKKAMGVLVVPELIGTVKCAAFDNGVKVLDILPQTWRSQLGIKGVSKGIGKGKDFKTPTKNYVNTLIKVPEEVISNITKNNRQTPSDVYDAIAIGLGWLKKYGFKANTTKCEFNSHIES